MRFFRNAVMIWAALAVLSLSGCLLKKRRPPIPQQGQAPTITAPLPESIPEQAETAPPSPPPPPVQAEKPKPKRHKVSKKTPPLPPPQPAPSTQAQSTPAKPGRVVIQEGGGPSQGQLTASLGPEEATHQRQTTQQLLDSTQANLSSLRRDLTTEEQAMVAQIKDYVEQSKKAIIEADPVRAHNLALKAHLLSDELVRR